MAITAIETSLSGAKCINIKITTDTDIAPGVSTIKLQYSVTSGGPFEDVLDTDYKIVRDSSKDDEGNNPGATSSEWYWYYTAITGTTDYYSYMEKDIETQKSIAQIFPNGFYKALDTATSVESAEIEITDSIPPGKLLLGSPVKVIGSSIIQAKFDAPIRNLFLTRDVIPYGTILENLYYTLNDGAPIPFKVNPETFMGYMSDDGKTLTIEDRSLRFSASGNYRLYINYNDFQTVPIGSKILRNYDAAKTPINAEMEDFVGGNPVELASSIDLEDVTRNELTVSFDKAVLLPTPEDLIYNNILVSSYTNASGITNSTNHKIASAKRVNTDYKPSSSDDYTKMKFYLDSSTPLPNESLVITVGSSSSDLKGILLNPSFAFIPEINSSPTTPTIIKPKAAANQNMNPKVEGYTELDVTFNQPMGLSAVNPINYKLIDPSDASKSLTPDKAEFIDVTEKSVVKLTFNNLITGKKSLVISDVKNDIDDPTDPSPFEISEITFKDTTMPKVAEIIALNKSPNNTGNTVTSEDNGLIIKFETPMKNTDPNAANNSTNYKFVEKKNGITTNPTQNPLPAEIASFVDSKDEKWVLFTLPEDSNYPVFENDPLLKISNTTTGNPNKNYDIHIGYTGLTQEDYKYVANTADNIYEICDIKKIDATVPLIDLSKGIVTLINGNTLQYEYTDKTILNNKIYTNEFAQSTILPENFIVYCSNDLDCLNIDVPPVIPQIQTVTLDSTGTKLTFTFEEGTFSPSNKIAYVATTTSVLDIFNHNISNHFCGNLVNNIPSKLESLSLIDLVKHSTKDVYNENVVGYPIEIAAEFSNTIVTTSARDFFIGLEAEPESELPSTIQNIPVSSAEILKVNGENTNVIILKGYIPNIVENGANYNAIYVRTTNTVNNEFLRTKDINKNYIEATGLTRVQSLNVDNGLFRFTNKDDLHEAILTINYNNPLDFTTLPPEISTPEGLTIKDLQFTQFNTESNFFYIASSPSYPQFGYIVINCLDNTVPIFTSGNNDTMFSLNAVTLGPNNFTFTFLKQNEEDDLTVNTANLLYIEYMPVKYDFKGIITVNSKDLSIFANAAFESNANTTIK